MKQCLSNKQGSGLIGISKSNSISNISKNPSLSYFMIVVFFRYWHTANPRWTKYIGNSGCTSRMIWEKKSATRRATSIYNILIFLLLLLILSFVSLSYSIFNNNCYIIILCSIDPLVLMWKPTLVSRAIIRLYDLDRLTLYDNTPSQHQTYGKSFNFCILGDRRVRSVYCSFFELSRCAFLLLKISHK